MNGWMQSLETRGVLIMDEYLQWLDSLPKASGALKAIQLRGRESLKRLGLPNQAIEEWRLSDIAHLKKIIQYPYVKELNQIFDEENPIKSLVDNKIQIIIDSQDIHKESINLPKGIRHLNQSELEQSLGHSIEKCSFMDNWTVAMNHAATMEVLGLKVEGKNLPLIEIVIPSQRDSFIPTRVIIFVEENAELELTQIIQGSQNSVHSHVIEVHLGQEAKVNHGLLAFGEMNSSLMANIAIEQNARSNYSLTTVQEGWLFSRLEPRVVQIEGQAHTNIKGLQISKGKDQIATHSLVRFDGPEGTLDQLQKAAAADHSHCIFNGSIEVPRIAQKTNANQLSRNLLLSSNARIDTKPELEIVADDVRCAHGATVSQLEEEQIFYLRSRGIEDDQAAALIFKGYCQEILNCLPQNKDKTQIMQKLLRGMRK